MSPRLIRNLIDVPERVSRGDFVLKLSEGVTRPEETVRLYHVTPALRRDFDDALSLIRAALEGGSSKAAYLDGSFGAGKSHFMAVLLLLLQGHAAARSREELHPVLRKHPWGEGRRFLLVPYHMIGAPSMEAGVLGGYVEQVRRLHPGCPVPGVFVAEGIFDNARELRASLGDERFFARLSEAAPGDDDWGDLGEAWDAGRFEQALAAPPGDELRHRLVGDLVATHFTAYKTVADQEGEGYVGLDEGLSVISRHAKELGYDALILFLDELVLWLATRSADLPFIQREGVKLPKLVEAQRPRHLPVVSFVARQRDLRELIGRNAPGAQAASFYDAVQWAEERFGRIVLEDRDLPEIVQARVLAPRSDAARAEIDAAFERTAAAREEVMRVLTTDEGDRAMFRRVYPFSPALVDALVAISSVLQRERTALKVLVELLVEQRDTLELDQVVPVGDLWDVVAHGDEPFSDVMRSSFEQAKKLYHQRLRSFPTNSLHVAGITDPSPLPALRRKTGTSKYRHLRRALAAGRLGAPARSGICREALRPILERDHGVVWHRDRGSSDPAVQARLRSYRADDRLAKTLLLAALVPEARSLKPMTAGRLAALNHGTITSPIPGNEAADVLNRVRRWAGEVGELKVGGEADPVLSLQLTGVDVDGILERVQSQDKAGNRIRKVRELLFDAAGITASDDLFLEHRLVWRGTTRTIDLAYTNVREASVQVLRATPGRWRLVLDYPFDETGYSPRDDESRLEDFPDEEPGGSRSLVWLPSFLSAEAQRDLGTLVKLDFLLAGDNFEHNTQHLAPADRPQARVLLVNRRDALRTKLTGALAAAYGLANPEGDVLDTTHALDRHLFSLDPTFEPRLPGAGGLARALEELLGQALAHQLPGHPDFPHDRAIRRGELKKVFEAVRQAAETEDGRVPVERADRRTVRDIAGPLRLGEMAETHFVLGTHWRDRLERSRAAEGLEEVTIRQLRGWMDPEDEPTGLTPEVGHLVACAYALQTNRVPYLYGGCIPLAPDGLKDDVVLREQPLPPEADWEEARRRAATLLGKEVSPLCNASNVTGLAEDVQAVVAAGQADCGRLPQRPLQGAGSVGASQEDVEGWSRLGTARSVEALLAALDGLEPRELVTRLARHELGAGEDVMAKSLSSAGEVSGHLEHFPWDLMRLVGDLDDDRREAAQALLAEVRAVLSADELVVPLGPQVAGFRERALRLLRPPAPPPDERWEAVASGRCSRRPWQEARETWEALEQAAEKHPEGRVSLAWKVEVLRRDG